MKRQQLLTLIILVVVVGGLGLFLLKRDNESWNAPDTRAGGKLLGDFPLNDVVKVRIKGATNEITLVKKDEIWTVQERENYPASFSKVGEVVRKLWELKVVQPQTATADTLARFQLLPPGQGTNSATLVELKDKDDKVVATLRAGKKHMSQSSGGFGGEWPDGRYVMTGDDVKSVALIKDALTDLDPQPEQWVDKDFFKVTRIQSIAVTAPEPTNQWSVTRESESGDWRLADLPAEKELDKTKTSALGGLLASPYFNDLALGKKPEELGFDHARQATIKTFDNFTYTVQIGSTNGEGNYYVKVDVQAALPETREAKPDEKPEDKEAADKAFKTKQEELSTKLKKEQRLKDWTYIVSKWTVDPLLKSKDELITDKKAEVKPPTPASNPGANLFPDPTLPAPPSPPGLPKAPKKEETVPPKPSEPTEEKPAEPAKPAEPEKPAEEPKPAEQPKPAEEPAEQPKPAEEPKPAEPQKAADESKPGEPKPADESKPAEQPAKGAL